MPDVDIVYANVARKFRRVYQQLCEGILAPEDLSGTIAKALISTLKDVGASPFEIILKTLKSCFDDAGIGMPIDAAAAGSLAEELARESPARLRFSFLATESLKAGLMNTGNLYDYDRALKAIISEFVSRLLDAEFKERLPFTGHHMNASTEEVEARLLEAKPHIDAHLAHIVDQMARKESVQKLRRKPVTRNASSDFTKMDISLPHGGSKEGD